MDDTTLSNGQIPNENHSPVNVSGSKKNITNSAARKVLRDISNTKGSLNTHEHRSPIKPPATKLSTSYIDPNSYYVSTNLLPHGATLGNASSLSEVNHTTNCSRCGQLLHGLRGVCSCQSSKVDGVVTDKRAPYAADQHLCGNIDDYELHDFTSNREVRSSINQILKENVTSHRVENRKEYIDESIMVSGEGSYEQKADLKLSSDISIAYIEDSDRHDIAMASEYADDIFNYMRELEVKMLPSHDYMNRQPELKWYMRRILFDWIVQVHERFTLLPETLFLCVNLIDRFLSVKEVSTDKLQLVGITALLIAAKYEELDAPTVSSMVYMTDETYTREELQKAERFMINMLNYELGFPGPLNFLRRISKSDDYDLSIRIMAKYLVEVTVMHECFISYPPSLLAASCYYVAMMILQKEQWTSTHIHYSGYTEESLLCCAKQLLECLENPSRHQTVYNKYGSDKYMNVSQYITECLASYTGS